MNISSLKIQINKPFIEPKPVYSKRYDNVSFSKNNNLNELRLLGNYNRVNINFGCFVDGVVFGMFKKSIDTTLDNALGGEKIKIYKGESLNKINEHHYLQTGEIYDVRENATLKPLYPEKGENAIKQSVLMELFCSKKEIRPDNLITLRKDEDYDWLRFGYEKSIENTANGKGFLDSDFSSFMVVQENHEHHELNNNEIIKYNDDQPLASFLLKKEDKKLYMIHINEFPGFEDGDIVENSIKMLLEKHILRRQTVQKIDEFIIKSRAIQNHSMKEAIEALGIFKEVDGDYHLKLEDNPKTLISLRKKVINNTHNCDHSHEH